MKRFLIHVSTYWCGMENTFRAEAENEFELYELAEQLAYDNFQSYGCEADIAEEEGYDPDEMTGISCGRRQTNLNTIISLLKSSKVTMKSGKSMEELCINNFSNMNEILDGLLSKLESLENEASKIKLEASKIIFDSVESGNMSKEEALSILTGNKLLPIAEWITLPDFMDSYDYFNRYTTIYYMDYMDEYSFGEHEYATWPELTYEEGIDELYDFVKENKIIGCVYDW